MAFMAIPAIRAAKPTHLAVLFFSLLLVFIITASLVPFKLKDHLRERRNNLHRFDDSIISPRIRPRVREFALKQSSNYTEHRRFLELKKHLKVLDRHHDFAFVLHSVPHPPSHPSRPYYVMINEAGEYVQTIEDGHPDYPLSRLADFREPRNAGREEIFFFLVPKTNGGLMKAIISECYNLRMSEKSNDPETMTFIDGVLNIDTQTLNGLAHARANKIIDSGLVDVFSTSYFLEGMLLFRTNHRGRAFTILQHPVLRAESLYHSRHSTLEWLGLPGYLESAHYIDNWVVRSLTNEKKGTLTEDHLTIAKAIIARKFFIGIAEHLEETIKRLELYYEWGEVSDGGECVNKYLKVHLEELESPRAIERGDDYWNLVATKDKYDLMLYYYALELFVKQGSTMFNRPHVDKDGKPINFPALRKKRQEKELLARLGLPPI